jgi:NitT/TauT family transport system substrate-binding protein
MMIKNTFLAATVSIAASFASSVFAETKDLTLQLGWLPNSSNAGEIIALKRGFFEEAGLNVSILPGGPGANPIQELVGGSADVVIGYAPQIMYAVNRGLPLASFGAAFQKAPLTFFSLGEKNITSVADWKGMRVGAAPSAKPQIAALLANAGLGFDDITFIQGNTAALMQDQADIVGGWPTNLAQVGPIIEHDGGYNAQSIWDNGLQFQSNYYVTTKDNLANDTDMLEAFMRAADKGWAWVADNQEAAVALLIEYAPALQADRETPSLAMTVEEFIYTSETATEGFANVSMDRWQATLDTYAKLGEISADLTAADVHTDVILNAVERTKRD